MRDIAAIVNAISVPTQSAIRIEGPHGTVVWLDPFHLTEAEASHDATYLCITHAHYDHLSPDDIALVKNTSTHLIAPASTHEELAGISAAETTLMKAGETQTYSDLVIEAVPAYNVEQERLGMHPQAQDWLGYILSFTDNPVRIYCAGDTDQNPDNENVSCDVALIPIGGTYTCDPVQAAKFVNTIKPQVVIPIHYGSIVGSYSDFDAFKAHVDSGIEVVRKLQR